MGRLIDADALKAKAFGKRGGLIHTSDIDAMPTVDAVPVVRCKDCKYYNAGFECLIDGYGVERDPEWFCGDGERKDDDNGTD